MVRPMVERLPVEARLWLDDVRPAPVGWTRATTVAEAVYAMERFKVVEASLDHDLGACKHCLAKGGEAAATLHCPHVPDGYAFVQWMAEHGRWPAAKPRVHSLNPSGAAAMRQAIDRHWHPPLPGVAAPCPLDGARVVGILADLERPYVELWRDAEEFGERRDRQAEALPDGDDVLAAQGHAGLVFPGEARRFARRAT